VTLPVGELARSSFEVFGQTIPIRSLSRKEAFHIKEIQDDLDECETWILICGTDSTREEVDAFRSTHPADGVDPLVLAISRLSGIAVTVTENGEGPKA
jgi:hypothetical protein